MKDIIEIQRMIRYFKKSHANKLDNQEQMDKLVSSIIHPEDRNKQITKQEMQLFHTTSGKNMGPIGQLGIPLQITTN